MSNAELRGYREWFLGSIDSRIVELRREINADPSYRDWAPDGSVDSIDALGLWLSGQVETRPMTDDEIEEIRASSLFDFSFSEEEEELTSRTFSLAIDTDMYIGQTLRTHFPHLEWHQPLSSRRYAEFGQLVITGFGRPELNPVRIAVVYCYGIASGERNARRLGEVYRAWSKMATEVEGQREILE